MDRRDVLGFAFLHNISKKCQGSDKSKICYEFVINAQGFLRICVAQRAKTNPDLTSRSDVSSKICYRFIYRSIRDAGTWQIKGQDKSKKIYGFGSLRCLTCLDYQEVFKMWKKIFLFFSFPYTILYDKSIHPFYQYRLSILVKGMIKIVTLKDNQKSHLSLY